MLRFTTLALLATILGVAIYHGLHAQGRQSIQQTLRESRWKKRVLLLAAPTAQQADYQKQKALLATHTAALAERDFVVLDVLYSDLSAADRQFLLQEMGMQPPAFAVVLIGKDGGVKEKSARPIAPEALFRTVDKMPMRRQEMQPDH